MESNDLKMYVLKLENGKYYVGSTRAFIERLNQHLIGGTSYTSKNHVVDVVEVRSNAAPHDENMIVKEYMRKFGINNVRGGAYSNAELTASQVENLQAEINHDAGNCMYCGNPGHMMNKCTLRANAPLNVPVMYPPLSPPAYLYQIQVRGQSSGNNASPRSTGAKRVCEEAVCSRCGRENHTSASCYVKTTIDGSSTKKSKSGKRVKSGHKKGSVFLFSMWP